MPTLWSSKCRSAGKVMCNGPWSGSCSQLTTISLMAPNQAVAMRSVSQGSRVPLGHGGVQVPANQVGELLSHEEEIVAEGTSGARDLDQRDARQRAVLGEDIDDREQRGVELMDGGWLVDDLPLDALHKIGRQLANQRAEDGLFAREVKVSRALGSPGAGDDIVDSRAVIALFAKDVEGGFEQSAPRGVSFRAATGPRKAELQSDPRELTGGSVWLTRFSIVKLTGPG